jgi:hypothetical protein
MIFNPFYYSGTLKDPQRFAGRQEQVAEIFQAIHGAASVSVVGERQIGKSSLLRYVADPTVKRKNGLPPERYVFVYFDFQGFSDITPSEFWRLLLGQALPFLGDDTLSSDVLQVTAQESIELKDVFGLLQSFKQRDKRPVFLLDEFDSAAQNPHFDVNFFGGLRNLGNNFPLSFILASRYTLQELQYAHEDTFTSPFFNAFRPIYLPAFTPQEVNDLLDAALAGSNVTFERDDRNFLRYVSGHHPYLLQLGGYLLFDAHVKARVDHQTVQAQMAARSDQTWLYYWDGSENGEKLILATLALADQNEVDRYRLPQQFDQEMTNRLARRAILLPESLGGRPQIFSPLFSEWVARQVAFIASDRVDDLAALVEKAEVRDLGERWIDRTERLRRGFAWVDSRAIFKKLLVEKGPEAALNLLSQIILHYITH